VDAAGSVSVTDNGPGVPPEERARIFERFWRGGTRAGAGAGLGLAIVDEIMKAHRGTVSVAEAPGGGASFTLVFPPAPPRSARSAVHGDFICP